MLAMRQSDEVESWALAHVSDIFPSTLDNLEQVSWQWSPLEDVQVLNELGQGGRTHDDAIAVLGLKVGMPHRPPEGGGVTRDAVLGSFVPDHLCSREEGIVEVITRVLRTKW